ncbi:MFS general substrate transporter [Penicillium odoratum]|uniref:MFS general substrate transporter n=1 Tax=Penicillium odoratum TaxID=1167516 RepID=UPI0025473E49|nr:MFS general substrate transporter [Penicillium odoratum]KAJ5761244.1 MFS general substrate transporter [Penicillium odoratum]
MPWLGAYFAIELHATATFFVQSELTLKSLSMSTLAITPARTRNAKPASILVGWDENEPANPHNWSTKYKSWITFQLGMLAMAASLGSSIIAPAESTLADHFSISHEVAVLCISLYIIGFAFGPLCWAPFSELWGRRLSLLPPMVGLGLFSIGTATSQNIQSVLITRFFGGLFASSPVSNVGAIMGDIWAPKARGTAVVFYALAVIGGPTLGPTIGAALVVNPHLSWRWTEYIQAIWTFAVTLVAIFNLPETYSPVLLQNKAHRLRKETGNKAYYHTHEMTKLSPKTIITKHLSRPLLMLTTEPMVTCIALYASFVYALLYMTLEVFPIVFQEEHGFGLVESSLPFLALFVGVIFAMFVNLANQPRYARLVDAAGGKPVPEARCAPMAIGGVIFAIGLFWFGWTADPKIHWIAPVLAAVFIGAGFNIIFQQCMNFLIDTYQLYAASAVSANTFLRSALAAAFPLVASPMFRNLGVGPAMSLVGGIAVLAIPVPFIFIKYGATLRRRSEFAPIEE